MFGRLLLQYALQKFNHCGMMVMYWKDMSIYLYKQDKKKKTRLAKENNI